MFETACAHTVVFFPPTTCKASHLHGGRRIRTPLGDVWTRAHPICEYVHIPICLQCSFNGFKSGDKSCVLLKMWGMSAAPEHTRVCSGAHIGRQHSTSIIIGDPFTPAPGWSPTLGGGHDSFLSFSILKHLFWLRGVPPLPGYRVFKIMGSPVGSGCLLVYTVIFFSGNRIGD